MERMHYTITGEKVLMDERVSGAETNSTNTHSDCNFMPSHSDLLEAIRAEISEIEKFKWYLGERLGHDPLRDRSMNDICQEWITKYAADFRKWWQQQRKN
jgi:hypothetical protein